MLCPCSPWTGLRCGHALPGPIFRPHPRTCQIVFALGASQSDPFFSSFADERFELFPLVRCELTLLYSATFPRWEDKETRLAKARKRGRIWGSLVSENVQSIKLSIGARSARCCQISRPRVERSNVGRALRFQMKSGRLIQQDEIWHGGGRPRMNPGCPQGEKFGRKNKGV